MTRLIAEHTGQDLATIARDADRDRWFTAEQALRVRVRRPACWSRSRTSGPAGRPAADRAGLIMGHYTVPTVVEKTPSGERVVDVYSRLLSDRIIYLGTEIDDDVANVIVAQLLYLESDNPDREIGLYINSPGGSMSAMTAIYDTMQFVRAPVATTCVGQAASAAAVILAAGAPGRRAVLPHTRVLLHQPSAGGQGTISDLVPAGQGDAAGARGRWRRCSARTPGRTWRRCARTPTGTRSSPREQAVGYGLADHIITNRIPVVARPARAIAG